MNNRIEFIDIAKGILITSMLIGHIWNDGMIHDFIYTFHMPAFFLISGMLFHYSTTIEKPLCSALLGKIRALMVPYFFFEVYAILMHIVEYGATLNIKGYAFEMLSLHLYNGPLWFLFVMLLSETAFLVLYHLLGGLQGKSGYVLLSALAVALLFLPKFKAYINVTTAVMALFFLLIGYLFFAVLTECSIKGTVMALMITVLISLINKGVGMPDYQDGHRVLFIFGAVAGSYFILQTSQLLQPLRYPMLSFYGRNSLVLLGTHYPVLRLFQYFFHLERIPVAVGVLFLIALMLTEIPVIYVINRYFPFVVGRRKRVYQYEKRNAE